MRQFVVGARRGTFVIPAKKLRSAKIGLSSRRRPGPNAPSLRSSEAAAIPYRSERGPYGGATGLGLPHGAGPWAEGPRGDEGAGDHRISSQRLRPGPNVP